jgi:hypothetical protein
VWRTICSTTTRSPGHGAVVEANMKEGGMNDGEDKKEGNGEM